MKGSTSTSVKPVKHDSRGHSEKSEVVKISSPKQGAAARSVHGTEKRTLKRIRPKLSHTKYREKLIAKNRLREKPAP